MTYSVCYGGGKVFAGGLTFDAAERARVECRAIFGNAEIPERPDSCRGCGRATDQPGRLCIKCEHAEDDARDADDSELRAFYGEGES